jgi:hypothetical protein
MGLLNVALLFAGRARKTVVKSTALESRTAAAPYLNENEQLFATKYKLVLPSEEELRAELDRERAALQGPAPR